MHPSEAARYTGSPVLALERRRELHQAHRDLAFAISKAVGYLADPTRRPSDLEYASGAWDADFLLEKLADAASTYAILSESYR